MKSTRWLCFGKYALVSWLFAAASAPMAAPLPPAGSAPSLEVEIDRLIEAVTPQVIAWRRDIHQHPELGNREFRTAQLVAGLLRKWGYRVRTGVARTGVVGILRGAKPGPVVALRADMDALPVKELTGLPFASTVKTVFDGQQVDVMHACGHDAHTAMLLGVAEVVSRIRDRLPGTVALIFQPAEDSAPAGEEGGAEPMIQEGALRDPDVQAIFGLHVLPLPSGVLSLRPGAQMASVNTFAITVRGRQTHGAMPWTGVDPVVAAAQIVIGLQTIVSRQVDLTAAPAVITVGSIHGGVRSNIIPEQVELAGTIRCFDQEVLANIQQRIRQTATAIAQSVGANADVSFAAAGTPVVFNDPRLYQRLLPVLERIVGRNKLLTSNPLTIGEDFACYQRQVPGLFIFLGIAPTGMDPQKVPFNHSPYFDVDEEALPTGMRVLAQLALAFLQGG